MVTNQMKAETIVKQVLNICEASNRDNLEHDPKVGKPSSYNCWGFTEVMEGWEEHLRRVDQNTIEAYLAEFTRKVPRDQLTPGCIAVYKFPLDHPLRGRVSHTAIVVDPKAKTIIQKPGGDKLEIVSFMDVQVEYGPVAEYRERNP